MEAAERVGTYGVPRALACLSMHPTTRGADCAPTSAPVDYYISARRKAGDSAGKAAQRIVAASAVSRSAVPGPLQRGHPANACSPPTCRTCARPRCWPWG